MQSQKPTHTPTSSQNGKRGICLERDFDSASAPYVKRRREHNHSRCTEINDKDSDSDDGEGSDDDSHAQSRRERQVGIYSILSDRYETGTLFPLQSHV